MCHTLKDAANDERFINAVNWLKKEQKYRFNHEFFTKKDE